MKQNGNNIIFDDDITLTGNNTGEKLSNVLDGLLSRTSKLESYTKWIYKNGGVGGSGGGGGSSTSSYSLYATLNNVQLKGQYIYVNKSDYFPLYFKIQVPGGATYIANITYNIVNSSGVEEKKTEKVTLDISNSYQYSKDIYLNTNSLITIEVTDSIYNLTKQASATCVTQTYSLSASCVNNFGDNYSNEIFVSTVKNNGLNIISEYSFVVDATVTSWVEFDIGEKKITSNKISIEDKKGSITYDLITLGKENNWIPDNTTSGLYTATVYTNIEISGSEAVVEKDTITFTLVPESLFLLVQSDSGTIYTSSQKDLDSVYNFTTGNISLNLRAYFGTTINRPCEISYYINNETDAITTITEDLRNLRNISFFISEGGENQIHFRVMCDGVYFPSSSSYVTYYLYCKSPDSSISWPTAVWSLKDSSLQITNKDKWNGYFNFYRQGQQYGGTTIQDNSNVRPFESLRKETLGNILKMSSSRSYFEVTDISYNPITEYKTTTFFSIALQFNEINDDNAEIIRCRKKNNSSYYDMIIITQDTITINKDSISYYLPKTKYEDYGKSTSYHLLSLVSRYIKTVGTTPYYEVCVYVDGIMEGALGKYTNEYLVFDCIRFCSSNTLFSLVELDFLNTRFKQEVVNGQLQKTTQSLTEDILVYQYYLKYRSELLDTSLSVTKEEASLLEDSYCGGVNSLSTGDVIFTETQVNNVATVINVPTLMFEYNDSDGKFKDLLDKGDYGENDAVEVWEARVYWSEGNGAELTEIKPDSTLYPDSYFTFKIQGSSTRSYKCKNFTFSINNRNEAEDSSIYLFSPNFSNTDDSTFLPEQSFTLKADVVDSGHSNNNSIGKFVNKVCQSFDTGDSNHATVAKYIKNCLDGFPIVVYIKVLNADGTDTIYYQGVYNFNLGRDSYFNLGYRDPSVFLGNNGNFNIDTVTNGFTFYSITSDQGALKDGLIVAEIQGNSNYFDFSQWDSTILFETYPEVKGEAYMFGDLVIGSGLSETQAKGILQRMVYNVSKAGGYLFGDSVLRKTMSEDDSKHCGYDDGYKAYGEITRVKYETDSNGDYSVDSYGNKIKIYDSEGNPETETISVPLNQVPNYKIHYIKSVSNNSIIYNRKDLSSTDKYNSNPGTSTDLKNTIIGDISNGIYPWINYTSLVEYYTICMAFGLVDSVQKNMNLKSWSGTWNTSNNSGTGQFYIAFYDMDTCLGINNKGTDTTYFAFSDYWSYTNISNGSDTITPGRINIYRDYSPSDDQNAGDFYDTPSSYLFAIAKYAALSNPTTSESILGIDKLTTSPAYLWATWREKGGILESAESFIKNFFSNNLGSVAIPLINLNYRNKYLVRSESDESFSTTNFEKFHGTRISKATDWLDGRFHILDAYFNLSEDTSVIQYYDDEGIYSDLKITGTSVSEPKYTDIGGSSNLNLSGNSDIVALQDIFTRNSATFNQSNTTLNFLVKAKDYSPLSLYSPTKSYRYLLESNEINYNITLNLNGIQQYRCLGSNRWTYLNSIDTFKFSSLYINSKYLESLVATGSYPMSITGEDVILPSLKTLNLSGTNFSGKGFTVASSSSSEGGQITNSKFPNLNSVNLSNNSISATITDSSLLTLNISNKTGGNISISNCSELTNVNLGTGGSQNTPITTLDSFSFTNIPASLCTTTKTSNSSGDGGFSLQYTNIKTMTFSNTNTTETSRIEIKNDTKVTSITIIGFSQIYISDCPNLANVYITDPQGTGSNGNKLSNLYIYKCGNSAKTFSINNTDSGVADLRECAELKIITLRECNNLKNINLPEDHSINLPAYAFYGDTNLTYLKGGKVGTTNYIYLRGDHIFTHCQKFTLLEEEDGEVANLFVYPETTSLAETFYAQNGNVTLNAARTFVERCIPSSNSITNITSLFRYQSKIEYNSEMLIQDLTNSEHNYIDMSVFNKVTVADYCFYRCNISAWKKEMFTLGKNVSSISFTSYMSSRNNVTVITTTTDVLENIIDKITFLGVNLDFNWFIFNFSFIDNKGQILTNVILHDFFSPGGKKPKNVTSLCGIGLSIDTGVTYDWGTGDTKVFTQTNWPSLTKIDNFLYLQEYGDEQLNVEGLFNELTNINTNSILNLTKLSTPVNLYKLFNWESLVKQTNPLNYDHTMTYNFKIQKYITEDDFDELITLISIGNITAISFLFSNCKLLQKNNNKKTISLPILNTKITEINYLFYNFIAYKVDTFEGEINTILQKKELLYSDFSEFFTNLPKITNAKSAFSYTYQGVSLPFNFFNKRTETVDKSKYIIDSSSSLNPETTTKVKVEDYESDFVNISIYKYTYNQELTDVRDCFYRAHWLRDDSEGINARRFNGSESDLQKDYILNGSNKVYGYYYTKKSYTELVGTNLTKVNYFVRENKIDESGNTEITDLNDFQKEDDDGKYINNFQVGSNNEYTLYNFDVASDSKNKLFCPPDIFYGVSKSGQITGFFDCSNSGEEVLEGTIPTHLLSKCPNLSINNVFKCLNILPRKLWVENDYTGSKEKRTIYYYIPEYFTSATNLDYAFNFHFMLPNMGHKDTNGSLFVDAYYILLQKSLLSSGSTKSNVVSMQYAFPSISKSFYTNNQFIAICNTKTSVTRSYEPLHYGLMYIPDENKSTITLSNGTTETYYTGKDGLDITTSLKNLSFDNLINAEISIWLNGRLFDESFSLNNYKKTSGSNYIIESKNWLGYNYLSAQLIFPLVNSGVSFSDKKIIHFNGTDNVLYITKDQIEGTVKDPYKTIGETGKHIEIKE